MKSKSFPSSYEKLYLVTPEIYEKLMSKLDSSEANQISSLNNTTNDDSENIPVSMNDNVEKEQEDNTKETMENVQPNTDSNSLLTAESNDNVSKIQNNTETNNDSNTPSNTSAPTNDSNCSIKPYQCNICGKRYVTPFTLKRHKNTKHGNGRIEKQLE